MLGGNPTLSADTFRTPRDLVDADAMTIQGTVYKAMALLGICVVCASFAWGAASSGASYTPALVFGGAIAGLITALITIFKPVWSPTTAPIYAAFEGLFLGGVSYMYHSATVGSATQQNGLAIDSIVVQAVGLTLGVATSMLILYAFRIITVTAKLRAGIMMATGGIFLFYIAAMVLGLFGVSVPLLHSSGPMGIGLSVVIVAVAAFNLLLDFDRIERGAQQGAPKYMEWYGGFALLVTLVWLYLEILRLLSKLRQR